MRHWTLFVATAFGATLGFACAEDESEPLNDEVARVCDDFCDRAFACDEDLVSGDDRTECLENCYGKADECADVGELDRGLDDIRACSEDCEGFTSCSIAVDVDCFL